MNKRIGIQGIKGSFHHLVAMDYYHKDVEVMEHMSFHELAEKLSVKESDEAVMAIENSIAGSILPNYALINEYNLSIIGEHYTPVNMNLMAVKGQKIEDIKKVFSHPMALLQCKEFFKKHPHIKLIEDADTAEAAKRISEEGKMKVAAVASPAAAKMYGLEILAKEVHTIKSNATRFLVLGTERQKPNGEVLDKASIKFDLKSERGSLVSVLNIIRDCYLDMTKIQSLPIIDEPWKYSFFVDVIFEKYEDLEKGLDVLKLMTEELKVLGIYKNNLV
ncbi:prephenate dehydratase [Christiangramia forsetii]|uniref:Bifunctional chorismate mutase/prephenate dehydratase n=2 Tax=Christiangramia forsetii TaxID=411153 RepID=A0LY81_CHRFK|nr:prephenate dehydratase [Christiangramia forsetii]GGG34845.1 prephenate dehydratase [Christiangramia forsetii]CAL65326.1 prephenate dehydratase [Christiangramia forsetii KT0803]